MYFFSGRGGLNSKSKTKTYCINKLQSTITITVNYRLPILNSVSALSTYIHVHVHDVMYVLSTGTDECCMSCTIMHNISEIQDKIRQDTRHDNDNRKRRQDDKTR